MKTPLKDRREEKLDRIGAIMVFGIFYFTLAYTIIEYFLQNN
jgi:hypothetical protein